MDDREEAIDILTRMSTNHFYGHREQEAFKLAVEALSAERCGRWKCVSIGRYGCSLCGHEPYYVKDLHYCPNCGARMDGEEK